VREIATQCGAKFTAHNTAPADLRDLYRLSLAMGQDAQARDAVNRAVSLASTAEAKAQVLRFAVVDALDAKPSRTASADSMLARLDVLGAPAHVARLFAHRARIDDAWGTFDQPVLRRESDAVMTALSSFDTDELDTWPTIGAVFDVWLPLALYEKPSELGTSIQRFTPFATRVHGGKEKDAIMARFAFSAQGWMSLANTTFPALRGGTWFNATSTPAYPRAGHPMLLVAVNHTCGSRCHNGYAAIARFRARYPDVDIVLASGTSGYMQGEGVLTPAQEIASIRHYFLDYLHLDVTLRVTETQFQFVPPDGRRAPLPSASMGVWDPFLTYGGNAILLGPDAKPLWAGPFLGSDPDIERRTYGVIEAHLARLATGAK